jgi:hypothetical protein
LLRKNSGGFELQFGKDSHLEFGHAGPDLFLGYRDPDRQKWVIIT